MLSLSLVDSRRFIAINRVYPEAHTSHLHSHFFQAVASHELVALSQLWICFLQKKKNQQNISCDWRDVKAGGRTGLWRLWTDDDCYVMAGALGSVHFRLSLRQLDADGQQPLSLSCSFHFEILFPSAERVAASQNRQFRQWKKMQLISFIF